jgi:hypothetical protein
MGQKSLISFTKWSINTEFFSTSKPAAFPLQLTDEIAKTQAQYVLNTTQHSSLSKTNLPQ